MENETTIEARRTAYRLMDDYVAGSIARNNCCDPYDCMCHEMCNEELGYCGGCQERARAYHMAVSACASAGMDFGDVERDAYKNVEVQRNAYYSETRHDNNAGAHWSDTGGYNAE